MERLVLDTNILIRFLTGEPVGQARRCRDLFERSDLICRIPDLVFAEAAWVLERIYSLERVTVRDSLLLLVRQPGIDCDRDLLEQTLESYGTGGLSFVDAYVLASAAKSGCQAATFDRGLKRALGERSFVV